MLSATPTALHAAGQPYDACLMAVMGRQLKLVGHAFCLATFDFSLLATPGETNCETLPPIMAICRTSVPVMCRTPGLAGRNTVSTSGTIAPFVPAICIS